MLPGLNSHRNLSEFVPLAIDVIEAIRAKKASAKEESERKAEALQVLPFPLLVLLPFYAYFRHGRVLRTSCSTACLLRSWRPNCWKPLRR